eukprot:g15615.t1
MATEFYDPAMGGPEGGGPQGITQKVNLKSQPPPLPPPPMPRAPIYIFNLFVPPLLVFSLVYKHELRPLYAMQAMRERSGVDPSVTPAASLSDTGKIYFTGSTYVDITRGYAVWPGHTTMSYQSDDTYCVAPIVVQDAVQTSYDYWAVGINCCRTSDPSFEGCVDRSVSSSPAPAGLRVIFPEQLPYFRLAVEQSEAEYNILAGDREPNQNRRSASSEQ